MELLIGIRCEKSHALAELDLFFVDVPETLIQLFLACFLEVLKHEQACNALKEFELF